MIIGFMMTVDRATIYIVILHRIWVLQDNTLPRDRDFS